MKMSKKLRAIASAALISAMVMSMNGMSALAAETSTETVTITKKLEKPENVLAPATTFEFNVEYVGETSKTVLTEKQIDAAKRGVSFKDNKNTIVSTPSEAQMGLTTLLYDEKPELVVDISKYSVPGVYRYKVTETDNGYEGMKYDTDLRYFDVAIGYKENETKLSVLYEMFVNEAGTAKADATFNNQYGAGKMTGALNNLVVTKRVSGNQVENGKKYEFTITMSDMATGEEFGVMLPNGTKTKTTNGAITVELGKDESVTIYGLSENDKYVVTERDYKDQGYTTTFNIVGNDSITSIEASENDEDGKAIHTTTTGDARTLKTSEDSKAVEVNTVEFTNTKNVTTPTGIVMSFAPYALVLLLAGVFGVMFLRKKREEF